MNTNQKTLEATVESLAGLQPEDRARALEILSALKTDEERAAFVQELEPLAEKLRVFREAADQALVRMRSLVQRAERSAKKSDRRKRERSSAGREKKRLKKLQSSIENT